LPNAAPFITAALTIAAPLVRAQFFLAAAALEAPCRCPRRGGAAWLAEGWPAPRRASAGM